MLEKPYALQPLAFHASPAPTVGIEMELWLVDPESRELTSRSPQFLEHFGTDVPGRTDAWLKPELWQSIVELNTAKCASIAEARSDLVGKLKRTLAFADSIGVAVMSSGTHPFSDWRHQSVSPNERYGRLLQLHRWPAERLLISGLHVHVGVNSGEKAIALTNSLACYIPHLLALSASSPFWHARETGLYSSRSKIFEGLPKVGLPPSLNNWGDFCTLMHTLIASNTINNIRDIWWDIRPHPLLGTVETRICDALPTLEENLAVAALIQAMVVHFGELYDQGNQLPILRHWTLAENKWRAIRHGLNATLIRNERGELVHVKDHLHELLELLAPTATALDTERELNFVAHMCNRGNSADRQLRIYAEQDKNLFAVVDQLVGELEESLANLPE